MLIYFSLVRGVDFINFTIEIQLSSQFLNGLTRNLFITFVVNFPYLELDYYIINSEQYNQIIEQAGNTLAQELI